MHSCSMNIIVTAILQLAQEIVQLIQKHLRLIADQAHLFFLIVNCSCPTHHGSTLLFNPLHGKVLVAAGGQRGGF